MGVLEDKLKLLPTNPGVYVMLNQDKQIIYVGKAKNLKNRVRQYFFNTVKTDKVMAMVSNIADFYYYIVPSEIDALSLENNLIKKYKPRYNILLKDDKTYPYLKINLKEDYPYFFITRKLKKDGAKYFGPFMGGINVNSLLDMINLLYGIRPCDKKISLTKKVKPCLNYHIKKCVAPCAYEIDRTAYSKKVNDAVSFLSGDIEQAEKTLTEKMLACAEKEDFETALKIKENIASLQKLKIKRITTLNKFLSADIIAYSSNGIFSCVNLLMVRNGIMLGGKNFDFSSVAFSESEALRDFITSYYKDGVDIPEEIICGQDIEDIPLLEDYFKVKLFKSVSVLVVKQGIRKQLSDMAKVNAEEHLQTAIDKVEHKNDMTVMACSSLKEKLNLSRFPYRMECYDISNISGVDKVGSMVVFINGEKASTEYRRFKIKSFSGADDYRSHQEMMARRLEKLISGDEKFQKPDLMIIDGGKGQLNAVKEVFDKYDVKDIDLIALAEREEDIYVLDKKDPIKLEKSDYCLRLLQRIRDEAHRFAINYFRAIHGKNSLSSVLDNVKGLGKVKKLALLDKFKDLSGILNASISELKTVDGIGEKQAQLIIDTLTKEGLK